MSEESWENTYTVRFFSMAPKSLVWQMYHVSSGSSFRFFLFLNLFIYVVFEGFFFPLTLPFQLLPTVLAPTCTSQCNNTSLPSFFSLNFHCFVCCYQLDYDRAHKCHKTVDKRSQIRWWNSLLAILCEVGGWMLSSKSIPSHLFMINLHQKNGVMNG